MYEWSEKQFGFKEMRKEKQRVEFEDSTESTSPTGQRITTVYLPLMDGMI